MTDTPERAAARARILDEALHHVPFDGWTMTSLAAGARDAGFDDGAAAALRFFPGGAAEAITLWSETADRRMLERMEGADFARLRTRDRIAAAVRARLEAAAPHKEALRRAFALLAQPQHAHLGPKLLWRTVDLLWYAAGDTATDFNHYTKRALLAGVYGATALFWLDDRSEGHAATWAFLDRRLAEVLAVPRALAQIAERLAAFMPWNLRPRGAR